MKKHGIYVIKWRDHYSTNGFLEADLEDIVDSVVLTTVGFFIRQDKNYYHFVQTIGEDMAAEAMSILKNQVVELKEINY